MKDTLKTYSTKLSEENFKTLKRLEVELGMNRTEFLLMLVDLLKERMEEEK